MFALSDETIAYLHIGKNWFSHFYIPTFYRLSGFDLREELSLAVLRDEHDAVLVHRVVGGRVHGDRGVMELQVLR